MTAFEAESMDLSDRKQGCNFCLQEKPNAECRPVAFVDRVAFSCESFVEVGGALKMPDQTILAAPTLKLGKDKIFEKDQLGVDKCRRLCYS